MNERTLAITDKVAGTVTDTAEIALSADRKTLTITAHTVGHTAPNIFVFERQ